MQNKNVVVDDACKPWSPVETAPRRPGWSRNGACYQIHPTTEEILYHYTVKVKQPL